MSECADYEMDNFEDDSEVLDEEVEHYPTFDEIAQENGFMGWEESYY